MECEHDTVKFDETWITIHTAHFPMYRAYHNNNDGMKTEFYFSKREAEIALKYDKVVSANE